MQPLSHRIRTALTLTRWPALAINYTCIRVPYMNQLSLSLGFLGHVDYSSTEVKVYLFQDLCTSLKMALHILRTILNTKYLAFRTSKCLVSSILFGRNMGCTLSGFWHNLFHCSSCKAWRYDQTISYWWGTACYTKSSVNFFLKV